MLPNVFYNSIPGVVNGPLFWLVESSLVGGLGLLYSEMFRIMFVFAILATVMESISNSSGFTDGPYSSSHHRR